MKWEYHYLEANRPVGRWRALGEFDFAAFHGELNNLGAQGWELVSTVGIQHNGFTMSLLATLKRQKSTQI